MKKNFIYFLMILTACNEPEKQEPPKELSAEDQLKEQVAKFPDSLLLKENLIQYYRENGNYENALKEVNYAVQKDTGNIRLWDIKAILHFEDGDTLQSIRSFEKALSIYPLPEDMISLATLYAQTKNAKALSLADTLLIKFKPDATKQALFIKGLYYSFTEDKIKAIGFFDQCLALDFHNMDAYREKAIALYDLKKYEDALTVLNRAITLENNFDEGYYYKGRCLEKLNRKEEAIEAYQSALMYTPDYIEAKDALARLGVKG
ncbi:MAG: tetratricopeptide repeat protein [Ferruginibacter sp.]